VVVRAERTEVTMAESEVEAKTEVKTDNAGFLGEGVRDGRNRSSKGGVENEDEVWSGSGQDFSGESGRFWQASRLMERYGKDLSSGAGPETGTGRHRQGSTVSGGDQGVRVDGE